MYQTILQYIQLVTNFKPVMPERHFCKIYLSCWKEYLYYCTILVMVLQCPIASYTFSNRSLKKAICLKIQNRSHLTFYYYYRNCPVDYTTSFFSIPRTSYYKKQVHLFQNSSDTLPESSVNFHFQESIFLRQTLIYLS
jgi:hypothetical protein